MEQTLLFRITGLLAIAGAFIYAVGDVLLLASKVSMGDHPKLQKYQKLLSGAEKMIVLTPRRMMWGALLGVFVTPLVLAGFWQVYQALQNVNPALALTMALLFMIASVIGAFVHGTFYYMGEYVRALNLVDDHSQVVIADMIERHRKVMLITYLPLLAFIVIASILFSVLVASGKTVLPAWMALINPVTMTIAWLLVKRFLPQIIRDWTEGAGFNIAYLAFFIFTTATLW